MTYVRAGLPPVMAIHGDADPIVPYEQEVREIDALKKAGGVAELITIPGGGHGNFPRDQVLRAWTAIDAFLQANVSTRSLSRPRPQCGRSRPAAATTVSSASFALSSCCTWAIEMSFTDRIASSSSRMSAPPSLYASSDMRRSCGTLCTTRVSSSVNAARRLRPHRGGALDIRARFREFGFEREIVRADLRRRLGNPALIAIEEGKRQRQTEEDGRAVDVLRRLHTAAQCRYGEPVALREEQSALVRRPVDDGWRPATGAAAAPSSITLPHPLARCRWARACPSRGRPARKPEQRRKLARRVLHVGFGVDDVNLHPFSLGLDAGHVVLAALAGFRTSAYDFFDALEIRQALADNPKLLLTRQQRGECLPDLQPSRAERFVHPPSFGGHVQIRGAHARLRAA
jgi:hypothetical protein